MNTVIEVSGLIKNFGPSRALDGLDLSVRSGEVHGFLGPNGAGKSTTIRILLSLMSADEGRAQLFGRDPWTDTATLHERLAYVPGDVSLWPNLTGGEAIDLLGRLRRGVNQGRQSELVELFELDLRKKCRSYSKGNRQKVALVSALSSDADLLILDEPTSGLDPLMEAVFQQCIQQERAAGRTIVLSSHILSEVEALCDRVSIVRAGRTVETGTLSELRHLTRTTLQADLTRTVPEIETMSGVHDVRWRAEKLHCQVDEAALGPVLSLLSSVGIRSLVSQPPTLEDLFLRHYASAR